MTEPAPGYNIVTDCREYAPEQVEHAFDSAILLVHILKTEIRRLRQKCDDLEAVSVQLLGELKAAQDGEKQPAIEVTYPEHWRQQE